MYIKFLEHEISFIWQEWRCFGVFIVNFQKILIGVSIVDFEQVLHVFFLLKAVFRRCSVKNCS